MKYLIYACVVIISFSNFTSHNSQRGTKKKLPKFTKTHAPFTVVTYLITPKDKSLNIKYYQALKSCVIQMQYWYKIQTGKTFTTNQIMVDTLKGLHNYDWYNNNNGDISGTDPRFYAFYNTYNDVQEQLGTNFDLNKYAFLVYVAAPGGGAGIKGFCAMGEEDLRGLIVDNPDNLNFNRWIGGGAHELGHSFGLPHPPSQVDSAIMSMGYTIYPNCYLLNEDKTILNNSPFFK